MFYIYISWVKVPKANKHNWICHSRLISTHYRFLSGGQDHFYQVFRIWSQCAQQHHAIYLIWNIVCPYWKFMVHFGLRWGILCAEYHITAVLSCMSSKHLVSTHSKLEYYYNLCHCAHNTKYRQTGLFPLSLSHSHSPPCDDRPLREAPCW